METVRQFFNHGGLVMWPLLGLSLFSLAMTLERLIFWLRTTRRQEQVLENIIDIYKENPNSVHKILMRNRHLSVARIFIVPLSLKRSTPEKFRLALETAAQAEMPLLKRFNNAFDVIISTSPLLGLLGTVLGLITSLSSLRIGDIGSSQATGVTGGIGVALTSTATGLILAIITLFFASMFRGLYLRQISLTQEFGGQLELLHLEQYEEQGEISHAIKQ